MRASNLCLLACLLLASCADKPALTVVENDFCKLRADFRIAEIADSSLAPAPGSLRDKLEQAEDAVCASK